MKVTALNSWLTLLLIILSGTNSIAQKSDADSLRLQIANEKNDTTRIKLLIQLGLNYAESDSLGSIYLKEAYDVSVKKKYRYGLAYGQYYKVLELTENGKYDEAIDICKQCIEALDSLHRIEGDLLIYIHYLFNLAGKEEERLQYFTQKAAYYKRHGFMRNLAICYHGIAGYYSHLADYDKAIEYLIHSMDVVKFIDPEFYAAEMQYIGTMYLEWGNLDKAEEYLRTGNNELIKLQMTLNNFFYYTKLGEIYFRRHDWIQSLYYVFESKKHINAPFQYAIFQLSCAAIHLEMNSIDSALFYLEGAEKIRQQEKIRIITSHGKFEIDYFFYKYYLKIRDKKSAFHRIRAALNEAESSRSVSLVLKYTNELHSYLIKQGDSIQAFRYLLQHQSLHDSVNSMNTRADIATFEIEQQQAQQENKIELLQTQKTTQRNYYLIGGAILLMIVFGIISRLRYKRKRDQEQLSSDFKKQLAQAEIKALRSQMNPHFIFNSLNSINSFVVDQKHELASEYLIKFSKLIRLILDNSRSETISIEKELETLKLYVLLEAARFDNKFKCIYNIAGDLNTNSIMIPPMLLQPFVENAIWHGLMQKEKEGTITIEIKKEDEEFLNISITDDGIGREKAAELKSKSATHKSHGLKVTSQRIEMMNKLNSTGAQVHIFDLKDEQGIATGTKVELIIPY